MVLVLLQLILLRKAKAMLNVCFAESECGLLKVALRSNEVTYSHRDLDRGCIAPGDFEKARRKVIDEDFDFLSKKEKSQIWEKDCKRFAHILHTARKDKELRVWIANNPRSKCGLYFIVYSLKDIDCTIFVVDMPDSAGYRDLSFDRSWGEADCDDVGYALQFEKELSSEEKQIYIETWKKLAEENAELRLNINGEVASVSIDYLDEEILSHVPRNESDKIGNVLGYMLGNSAHCVMASFVIWRIEAMIDSGILVVEDDNEIYYQTTIRLATENDNIKM